MKFAALLLTTIALGSNVIAATERALWPLRGTITQTYGWKGPKNGHSGIDIAARHGTAHLFTLRCLARLNLRAGMFTATAI